VFGIIWTLVTIAGWILVAVEHKGHNDPAGVLLILGWVGAIATSFMIKPAYRQLAESTFQDSVQIAERRLSERQRARKIAREQPALARELGVGRPDVAGAQDAGLVDINNAPASALAKLPGVDEQLATEIVEARAKVNGFESVEDLGAALDLDGNLVESLRDHTVFLPR
jgi:DNA uptake protein ComE-like DNA-binding protein